MPGHCLMRTLRQRRPEVQIAAFQDSMWLSAALVLIAFMLAGWALLVERSACRRPAPEAAD